MKFTLIIAFLVIFVVLLLAISLGYNMIMRTSSDLARGLDQRARVLLESVAQGGRFFLGKEDAVTQLSLFPSQAKAMEGANYITITGSGQRPQGRLGRGRLRDQRRRDRREARPRHPQRRPGDGPRPVRLQGARAGATPSRPSSRPRPQASCRTRPAAAIADELQLKVRPRRRRRPPSRRAPRATSAVREINAQLDAVDLRIRDELRSLSDQDVGSLPRFDPAALSARPASYLYLQAHPRVPAERQPPLPRHGPARGEHRRRSPRTSAPRPSTSFA